MITAPEIICDLFSFLDKDQIERIQLVNQFWNNVIIRHKNILPLRQFYYLGFYLNELRFRMTEEDVSYIINFDGTNLSKGNMPVKQGKCVPRYSQLTVDEVLNNLNDVVFESIQIVYCDDLLNLIKHVTEETGGKLCGKFGNIFDASKLDEIFDNYIIVDELVIGTYRDSCIREVCANPEIVQLPSTPKEIRLRRSEFNENEEVLHFISCNGKLNGANRVTIELETPNTNYGNFIRQWFELYRTHQNPISLVGKFEFITYQYYSVDNVLNAVKTFLNNTQLRVKYSFETKEFHMTYNDSLYIINHYLKRRCVLHETDSYALVIEMAYGEVTNMSSINASDLDQPSGFNMESISFCVKSL